MQAAARLREYADDPVGFGTEVLGEHYTDDVQRVMLSVRDNPVTIARSANAVGKTHGAARIALWWYLCHPGAQVYVCAAPPERNLRQLLWGELVSVCAKHPEILAGNSATDLLVKRGAREWISGRGARAADAGRFHAAS